MSRIIYQDGEEGFKVERNSGGLWIEYRRDGVTWAFAVDTFYVEDEDGRKDICAPCVQMIAYDPRYPDSDPLQHVRVHPDGQFTCFDC